jgi:hypothetical protein
MLKLFEERANGQRVFLADIEVADGQTVTVGRSRSCDILWGTQDVKVSRHQIDICSRDGGLRVVNRGKTRLALAGRKSSLATGAEQRLFPPVTLRVGDSSLRVETDEIDPPEVPVLEIYDERRKRVCRLSLRRGPISVGAGDDNDGVVKADGVSRNHATVEPLGNNRFMLRDAGSKNGVYAAEKKGAKPTRVDAVEIGLNQRFFFGPCSGRVVLPGPKSFWRRRPGLTVGLAMAALLLVWVVRPRAPAKQEVVGVVEREALLVADIRNAMAMQSADERAECLSFLLMDDRVRSSGYAAAVKTLLDVQNAEKALLELLRRAAGEAQKIQTAFAESPWRFDSQSALLREWIEQIEKQEALWKEQRAVAGSLPLMAGEGLVIDDATWNDSRKTSEALRSLAEGLDALIAWEREFREQGGVWERHRIEQWQRLAAVLDAETAARTASDLMAATDYESAVQTAFHAMAKAWSIRMEAPAEAVSAPMFPRRLPSVPELALDGFQPLSDSEQAEYRAWAEGFDAMDRVSSAYGQWAVLHALLERYGNGRLLKNERGLREAVARRVAALEHATRTMALNHVERIDKAIAYVRGLRHKPDTEILDLHVVAALFPDEHEIRAARALFGEGPAGKLDGAVISLLKAIQAYASDMYVKANYELEDARRRKMTDHIQAICRMTERLVRERRVSAAWVAGFSGLAHWVGKEMSSRQ